MGRRAPDRGCREGETQTRRRNSARPVCGRRRLHRGRSAARRYDAAGVKAGGMMFNARRKTLAWLLSIALTGPGFTACAQDQKVPKVAPRPADTLVMLPDGSDRKSVV